MASNEKVLDILAQTDLAGETAAPDDEYDETAGPNDDDDTAATELDGEEADTGDIMALKRRGRSSISLDEALALQARTRARAKKLAAKKAPQPRVKLPANMVHPNDTAMRLMNKWRQRPEVFVVRQDGHYYSVAEIRCICEGNNQIACLRIKGGTEYPMFHTVVGEDITLLGNPTKVSTNLTNLQRPSKTTYINQDFLIKSVTMQEAGLRVRYDAAEVDKIPAISDMKKMLVGEQWLWDDSGTFLPQQIFHDVTGENLLYRALRRSASLCFNWKELQAGAGNNNRSVLIDHLRNVPDSKEKSMSRTSGGAPVLSVKDGYIFSDNPEHYGAFTATIRVEEDILFPVKPVDIGGGTPLKPLEVGLYVQLSMNGISFEPKKNNN